MSSIGNSWGRKCQTKETEGVWGCELAVGVVWLWSEGNLEGWSETRGTWRVDEQNYPASKGTMWQLRHFLHSNQAKHVHPPYLLHSRFNTTSLLLPLSKMFTSCPFTLSQADVMNVWKSCLPKKIQLSLHSIFVSKLLTTFISNQLQQLLPDSWNSSMGHCNLCDFAWDIHGAQMTCKIHPRDKNRSYFAGFCANSTSLFVPLSP